MSKSSKFYELILDSGWKSTDIESGSLYNFEGVDFVLSHRGVLLCAVTSKLVDIEDIVIETSLFDLLVVYSGNTSFIYQVSTKKLLKKAKGIVTLEDLYGIDVVQKIIDLIGDDKGNSQPLRYFQKALLTTCIRSIVYNRKIVNIIMPQGSGKTIALQEAIKIIYESKKSIKFYVISGKMIFDSFLELFSLPIKRRVFFVHDIREIEDSGNSILLNLDASLPKNLADNIESKFLSFWNIYSSVRAMRGAIDYKLGIEDLMSSQQFDYNDALSIKLGDIAEIHVGAIKRKKEGDESRSETNKRLLTARDIGRDLYISDTTLANIEKNSRGYELEERYLIKNGDILVSRVGFSNKLRISYIDKVPEGERFYFNHTLIRIRSKETSKVGSKVLFGLIRLKESVILSFASKMSSQAMISISVLKNVLIQPPKDKHEEKRLKGDMDYEAEFLELKSNLMRVLDSYDPASLDKSDLIKTVSAVKDFLAPVNFRELVLQRFPMPISLAYSNFLKSKYNTYESLLRLRDLFEAICNFFYLAIYSDVSRNLDPSQKIKIKHRKTSIKDTSMAKKMSFLESTIGFHLANGSKPYIEEIMNVDIVRFGREMQSAFRNKLSHEITWPENKVKEVVLQYEIEVENFLKELLFLSEYKLVNYPSFHFKNELAVIRTKYFNGLHIEVEEERMEIDSLSPFEHDHLYLSRNDGVLLDMYPFYQEVSEKETLYQNHLCFMKKIKDSNVLGESLIFPVEVELEGATLILNFLENDEDS